MAKRAVRVLDTGVWAYYGRPGAGKSLVMTRRVLDVARFQGRVVYTNLPLRFRVVGQWLRNRGAPNARSLVVPLTERHFLAFLERFGRRQAHVDAARGRGLSVREAIVDWLDHAGPDVISGDAANWIPAGALVVIDEVHHWLPNPALRRDGARPEPAALLSYLTMHRHVGHWIWYASQAPRQVSTTLKSLTSEVVEVTAASDEPIAFGIRISVFGLRACGYRHWLPEDFGDGKPVGKPLRAYMLLASAPWVSWLFRLYSSVTHGADEKSLKRESEAARDHLLRSGVRFVPPENQDEDQVMAKRPGMLARLWGGAWKAAVVVALVCVGVVVGSRGSAPADDLAATDGVSDGPEAVVEAPVVPVVVSAVAPGRVRVGTRWMRVGEFDGAWQLGALDDLRRVSVWRLDDGVWVCSGIGSARYLGTYEDCAAAAGCQ